MRITNNMLVNNMIGYMSMNLKKLSQYQTMASTGRVISKASEDPVVAARSLKLTTDVAVLTQYKKNADSAVAWMSTTEAAIKDVSSILTDIRTKCVQASTDTLADEDREAIASQIKQLRDELINLANSTYTGRYLFSGYKSDTPLLDEDGFFNIAVSKLEDIRYEVGVTNTLSVNVTGDELFNMGEAVSYLPARSALVQDIDDLLAMFDRKATLTGSDAVAVNGPGLYDMSGVNVTITTSGGSVTADFDKAPVGSVKQMTGDEIIDFLNKQLGLLGTATRDENGNLVIRDRAGTGGSVAVSGAGAAKLLGSSPVSASGEITGTKSLTQPTVDVSGFASFDIVVDRAAAPITISLAGAAGIADPQNARLDEIAAAINAQIAAQVPSPPTATSAKWAKCTVEDGRLCLTSESFGSQSYIELAGGDEVTTLFGPAYTTKQGNVEQQGKLVGSRDFREPVADLTQFRDPVTGEAPTIKVKINGAYEAVIQLDDGDASIDPRNVTLRQIMGKIDEQLAGYGTCDIDGGRLVIRAANGGEASTIEYSGANEAFNEFLFGETPTIKNGANDPTHGYYRSGSMFKVGDAISMGSALNATISINDNKASTAPLTLAVTIPDGLDAMGVVDAINAAAEADPAVSQAMLPEAGNQYKLAVLVDGDGNQVYPPLNGAADPEPGTLVYIKLQSHTWGTGSTVMVEPQSSADDAAMAALFGKGTENPPSAMGGVDGFKDEACLWLDVADAELQNINRIWTDLGARMSRGELAQNRLETNKLVTETLQSQNIDVDEAYALMMLQMAETVYSASLATGARVIQPTLLDFIS